MESWIFQKISIGRYPYQGPDFKTLSPSYSQSIAVVVLHEISITKYSTVCFRYG